MKSCFRSFGIILILIWAFTSCSLIKNPHSGNFNKNKYRAHLGIAKQKQNKLPKENKTVLKKKVELTESFSSANSVPGMESKNSGLPKTAVQQDKFPLFASTDQPDRQEMPLFSRSDYAVVPLPNQPPLETSYTDGWWEEDPENWPWKELILAAILILLMIFIVLLLIDLLGALFGSILGLIILLLLIYLLLVYLN